MFLQLLVAQIKNQDPMNPADSLQFVSQLAQFSELEQVIGIRQDLETVAAGSGSNPAAPAAGPTS
jgi:flagellar basal-body rod modification protein FlgD